MSREQLLARLAGLERIIESRPRVSAVSGHDELTPKWQSGDWTYADFPVTADAVPLDFSGDAVRTLQANELRQALIRIFTQVGVSPASIPAEVEDLGTCWYTWLTAMRTAFEVVIAAGKYYIGADPFVAWTKATLLAHVHETFVDNALVTAPEEWMESADADSKLAGVKTLPGCPTFEETGDGADQVSGYDGLGAGVGDPGIKTRWLDADWKLYVSVVDVGGGQFRVDLFKDSARGAGDKVGHTANFGAAGGGSKAITADNGSALAGAITVTEPGGGWAADSDIEVLVEFDKSIMYADAMNELYYLGECLRYHPVVFGKGVAADSSIWHAGVNRPTAALAFADGWAAAKAAGWQAGAGWQASAHSQLATTGPDAKTEYPTAVAGTEQSGTVAFPKVAPSSFNIYIDDGVGHDLQVADDGAGNLAYVSGTVGLVSGTINYDTGEWYINTDFSWAGTETINIGYNSVGWSYVAPGISKVTSAGVVVPNVAYALSEILVPFTLANPLGGIGAMGQVCTVPGGTAGLLASEWGNTFLRAVKADGGWDNETVSPAHQFNLPGDIFGNNFEEHTWDVAAHLDWVGSSAAGYGRSKLGGYCNGEYQPF